MKNKYKNEKKIKWKKKFHFVKIERIISIK